MEGLLPPDFCIWWFGTMSSVSYRDPVGAHFFFQLQVQPPSASHISHPSGADIARASSNPILVCSLFNPPIGSDPQSHSDRILALASSPCLGLDHLCQAAND